jgi:hypothetical protein
VNASVPTQAALRRLPPLYRQSKTKDPLIYVKISTKDKGWSCYIAEGGRSETDYEVFALLVGKYGHQWAQVPLSSIQGKRSNTNVDVIEKPTRVSRLLGLKYVLRSA